MASPSGICAQKGADGPAIRRWTPWASVRVLLPCRTAAGPSHAGRLRLVDTEQIAVISGGVVGLAGVIVAGTSGWRDRVHARRDRQQQRLADTYLDLLELCEAMGDWCKFAHEPGTVDDWDEAVSQEQERRIRVKVNAYGSPQMRTALIEWSAGFKAVRDAVDEAEAARKDESRDASDVDRCLSEAQSKEEASRIRLNRIAYRELRR